MRIPVQKTASEWFQEAARCYLEGHQGCAWCGGAYRVFHRSWEQHQVYYCQGCDFQAGYDRQTDSYFTVPGGCEDRSGPDTMFAG